ncbi:hypothetical protein [Streptomyces goshikiensis]|uniref:hypothetical protein n=2 Tax=Streptomyces TaxID=1883 RepID=UPI0038002237
MRMARIDFPDDLLTTQTRVIRVYEALAQRGRGGSTVLRRELARELRLLYSHPYWSDSAHSYADLVELRRAARACAWREAA